MSWRGSTNRRSAGNSPWATSMAPNSGVDTWRPTRGAIGNTAIAQAPRVPTDHKWLALLMVANAMKRLDLRFPMVTGKAPGELVRVRGAAAAGLPKAVTGRPPCRGAHPLFSCGDVFSDLRVAASRQLIRGPAGQEVFSALHFWGPTLVTLSACLDSWHGSPSGTPVVMQRSWQLQPATTNRSSRTGGNGHQPAGSIRRSLPSRFDDRLWYNGSGRD